MRSRRCAAALGILLTLWVLALPARAQSLDDLILMTESFPPFNFEENGRLQGISVDLLERMLEIAGSRLRRSDIRLLPWARAYRDALEKKNAVLFLMNRNRMREKLFKWVGPVTPTIYALIAKKDRQIKIHSVTDLQQYRIGVVSRDLGEQLLLEMGIDQKNIDPVPSGDINVLKLNRHRIDLWNYEMSVAQWTIRQCGFDPKDYEAVYILKRNVSSYYAFHRETDDRVVIKLQGALDRLREKSSSGQESEYERIVNHYFGSATWSP